MYEKEYRGLESVKDALHDLNERKVWGKAVIEIGNSSDEQGSNEIEGRARL